MSDTQIKRSGFIGAPIGNAWGGLRAAVSGVKPAALSFRRETPYQLRLRNTRAQDHTFVSAGFFQAIALISGEKYILIKG